MSGNNNRAAATAFPASVLGKENAAVRPSPGQQLSPCLLSSTRQPFVEPIPRTQAAWTMQPPSMEIDTQRQEARPSHRAPNDVWPLAHRKGNVWPLAHRSGNVWPLAHRSGMPPHRETLERPTMSALPTNPNPNEVQVAHRKGNVQPTFPSILPTIPNPNEVQVEDRGMLTNTSNNGITHVYSEQDIVFLETLRKHFSALFPPGASTLWESPKALREAVQREADIYGFTVVHIGSSLRCTRHAEPLNWKKKRSESEVPEFKRRKVASYRCDCTFIMRWSEQKINGALSGKIRLTRSCNYQHANGCLPCPQQKIRDARHCGILCKEWLTEKKLEMIIEISGPSPAFKRCCSSKHGELYCQYSQS